MAKKLTKTTHSWVRQACLVLGFVFLIWTLTSLHWATDLIFDRLLAAVLFFALFFLYPRLHLNKYSLMAGAFALFIHQLKLYGNVYAGIEFDVYMHLIGSFAVALIIGNYLFATLGKDHAKLLIVLLTIFAAVGAASIIEITEFFAYTNLPPGEGILHFGAGDIVGGDLAKAELTGWADSALDQLFNVIGSTVAAFLLFFIHRKKH